MSHGNEIRGPYVPPTHPTGQAIYREVLHALWGGDPVEVFTAALADMRLSKANKDKLTKLVGDLVRSGEYAAIIAADTAGLKHAGQIQAQAARRKKTSHKKQLVEDYLANHSHDVSVNAIINHIKRQSGVTVSETLVRNIKRERQEK